MLLLKFGGSVITNKKKRDKIFREDTASRLIEELKLGLAVFRDNRAILVHGAGSFGHILAREHSIHRGNLGGGDYLTIVPRIRRDMRRLNHFVEKLLLEKGFHPISLPPEAVLYKEGEGIITPIPQGIAAMISFLQEGFMPVLFGDVIADKDLGFSICSGDDVMKVLSYLDEVERIIFVTAVDGIIGKNSNGTRGENIRENSPSGLLRDIFISNDDEVADVTGSMYGKAERIAEMAAGKEVLLINGNVPGRLESAVKGEPVIGTLIRT